MMQQTSLVSHWRQRLRVIGKLAACFTVAAILQAPANAEPGYPNRPVTIMVPYGSGGMGDVVLRMFAEKLDQRLGQQFVIENRPGGGGAIAAQATLARPPNGYTLFYNGSGMAISMSMFKVKPFDLMGAFKQISTIAVSTPLLFATGKNSALHSVQDIVAFGRANPGKLTIGTINPGSTQNLTAHLFKQVTGIDATVVTYRATPELITALIRGDVDFGIDYYAAFQPVPNDTRIRILAMTGEQRSPLLPDVPTLKEAEDSRSRRHHLEWPFGPQGRLGRDREDLQSCDGRGRRRRRSSTAYAEIRSHRRRQHAGGDDRKHDARNKKMVGRNREGRTRVALSSEHERPAQNALMDIYKQDRQSMCRLTPVTRPR